tara:strand:- start:275 stop:580 length:306 start_codon:yes stop_codon:yes gene_type:complete
MIIGKIRSGSFILKSFIANDISVVQSNPTTCIRYKPRKSQIDLVVLKTISLSFHLPSTKKLRANRSSPMLIRACENGSPTIMRAIEIRYIQRCWREVRAIG